MKRYIIFFLLIQFLLKGYSQDVYRLYQPQHFTKENLFTNNIEGPNFDYDGNLYVVNYQKDGTIGLVKPNGKTELFLTLPKGSVANSIQFDIKGKRMYLADYGKHDILKVNMRNKRVKVYAHAGFNQPNDLCITSKNIIFVSDPNWSNGTGKIWRVKRGKTVLLTDQMGTTNGMELSPDEKILYVNESVQRKIWAFDVDNKGMISNKRLFAEFADYGLDGMKCDNQNNLYVTRYGKGTIAVFSPEGKQIREIELIGKNCSNLIFGGINGKLIFITEQDLKGVEMFRNDVAGKDY